MKIARFLSNGAELLGTEPRDGTVEVLDGTLFQDLVATGRRVPVDTLLAPLIPPNLFGVGMNYREHARQMNAEIPSAPPLFMKPTTTIANPGSPIVVPEQCLAQPEVDYECELAVVIGRAAREVSVDQALDYVFGYTAANEVTARQLAKGCRQRGKSFDGFCPLGPYLVTADEIADPQALALKTILNDRVMQDGRTSDMIFSVAEIISYLSQGTTLLPGTVIVTGTPPGAGVARNPPVFLQPGDSVHIEIEKIGRLSNSVTAGAVSVAAAA